MRKINLPLIASGIFLFSQFALATGSGNGTVTVGSPNNGSGRTGGGIGTVTVQGGRDNSSGRDLAGDAERQRQAQQAAAQQAAAQQSANDAAKRAEKENKESMIISAVIGTGLTVMGGICTAQCFPVAEGCCTMAPMYFMMGAQSFQQANENNNAARAARRTNNQTFGGGGGDLGENVGDDPLADPGVQRLVNVDAARRAREQARRLGIDGKKPVKIGGKEYPADAFKDPGSMAAAGLPAGMIANAVSTMSNLEKEANKKLTKLGALTESNGYDDGAGGSVAGASGTDAAGVGGASAAGLGSSLRDPASTSLAGLSKNFNGDPIGVAADSLFQMMTRRYKLKEKQNSFIDDPSANLQK